MTYYAQSLSIFTFLFEREGVKFIRSMIKDLKQGKDMSSIIQKTGHFENGIEPFEDEWVRWVKDLNDS